MSNSIKTNMGLMVLDTADFLMDQGVEFRKIMLYPNAAGDAAVISVWDSKATPKATMASKTVTVSGGDTITSTGNFEAAEVAVGDIIQITASASGNNLGAFVVKTRSSDDAIVVGEKFTMHGLTDTTPLTNESTIVYSWKIITPFTAIPLLCNATEKAVHVFEIPGDSLVIPNLILTSITSGAKLYIYL